MDIRQAVFHLGMMERVCKQSHMDTEAEALSMAIDVLTEKERNRRAWEELIEEERT